MYAVVRHHNYRHFNYTYYSDFEILSIFTDLNLAKKEAKKQANLDNERLKKMSGTNHKINSRVEKNNEFKLYNTLCQYTLDDGLEQNVYSVFLLPEINKSYRFEDHYEDIDL